MLLGWMPRLAHALCNGLNKVSATSGGYISQRMPKAREITSCQAYSRLEYFESR